MTLAKTTLTAIGFLAIAGFAACAQTKKSSKGKSAASYARIIEATSQRHIPGMRDAAPRTEYKFILVWNSATPPVSFFWHGPDGTSVAGIAKVAKMNAAEAGENELPYKIVSTSAPQIKKGDTLQVMPMPDGEPVTEKLPAVKANRLIFKTGNTGWFSLPVGDIRILPKIVGQ